MHIYNVSHPVYLDNNSTLLEICFPSGAEHKGNFHLCLLLTHVKDLQQLKLWFQLRLFLQISFSYKNNFQSKFQESLKENKVCPDFSVSPVLELIIGT